MRDTLAPILYGRLGYYILRVSGKRSNRHYFSVLLSLLLLFAAPCVCVCARVVFGIGSRDFRPITGARVRTYGGGTIPCARLYYCYDCSLMANCTAYVYAFVPGVFRFTVSAWTYGKHAVLYARESRCASAVRPWRAKTKRRPSTQCVTYLHNNDVMYTIINT